jgi:hypothetical protein
MNTKDDEIRVYKPHLRFKIGDLVFLKSDLKKLTAMTITNYDSECDENFDYVLKYFTSQKMIQTVFLPDVALTE